MQNITLKYTGPEALEMTKQAFPKTWEKEVSISIKLLKSIMNIYKTDAIKAYQSFLNTGARPDNCVITLAALQVMHSNDKINKEINRLKAEQIQYGKQLTALEKMQKISFDEQCMLRGFYITRQQEHEKTISDLSSQFEVIDSETLEIKKSDFK